MHWTSLAEFLAMGGYAAYVWPSFGLALLVVVGLALASRRALRAAESELARLKQDGDA